MFTDSGLHRNDSGGRNRFLAAILLSAFVVPSADHPRGETGATLSIYAHARAAASAGALDRASVGYSAALAADPDNEVIAGQALTHAVTAGDWTLALRAARVLERRDSMLPDARFLLVAEAFRGRDWRAAGRQIDAIEREQLFAFAVPALRAWLAYGSGRGDPLSFLSVNDSASAAAGYSAEQRPLLLIAMRRPEGARLLLESPNQGPRTARLRIAGAATLAARGDRAAALHRDELASEMTREELAAALRAAREWVTRH